MFDRTYYATHPDMMECVSNDELRDRYLIEGLFREGECTIGALARTERVQPPSMTRTVNCLVDEGYAARRPHESDGRQVLVDITEKGREILLADRRRRDVRPRRHAREAVRPGGAGHRRDQLGRRLRDRTVDR